MAASSQKNRNVNNLNQNPVSAKPAT